MRVYEILLIVAMVSLWLRVALPPDPASRIARWWWVVLSAALLSAIVHVLIEGTRWQMVPIYLALVLLSSVVINTRWRATAPDMPSWVQPDVNPRYRRAVAILSAIGLILGLLLSIIFPVPLMPAPSGALPVGTLSLQLTDTAREEVFTDVTGNARTLMIQIWYPRQAQAGARLAPWITRADLFGPAIAGWLRLPAFMFSHIGLAQSSSVADAPLSDSAASYPVLVYSHGWGGFRQINATQNEELASHGYIVVALDHPYGAMSTVLADGTVLPNKRSLLPAKDAPEYMPAIQLLSDVYARDVGFVLDQLALLNAQDPRFAGHMDLAHLGLFGHSTGGGAIVALCARDPRCVAGVGQDAWVEPVADAVIQGGLKQPFLFMRSAPWTINPNDARLTQLIEHSTGPRYRIGIAGAGHYDYTMLSLFSPLAAQIGLKGPIPAARVIPLINDFMLAFFDAHLKGAPVTAISDVAARYPEATLDMP